MDRIGSDLAQRALDAAPDAMLMIDASGRIRFANQQVSALFGYPCKDLIGQGIEMLMPERFRASHVLHRQAYFRSVRARPMGAGLELLGRRQDGSEFPIEVSLSPVADDTGMLISAAIRDVTDRKAVEAELVEARRLAERASQAKSRFLATASHDLRQPLQTLSLLSGSLRRMLCNGVAADVLLQQELAIGAMSRLLNALLDISKLESGAIRPDPTDFTVATLFEELRGEFTSIAADKGLKLKVESSTACVHSDPSLVGQILRNLLSNAIKYTREGWVQLRCLHETARVRIEVLDTGIGIPADQLPHIYDEFYQIGSSDRARDGYGLGLSIVHHLVNLLALELDVRSEVGRGSTFSLLLPAAGSVTPYLAQSERGTTGKSTIATHRVLLIEDDPAVRTATRMLLEVNGCEVCAVGCLREALQAARGNRAFDLLIADYHLRGDETGTQAIATLREVAGSPLKALLLTGDTSSAIRNLSTDERLRIISKPINADDLLALLATFLVDGPLGEADSSALSAGAAPPDDLQYAGRFPAPGADPTLQCPG